MDQCVRVTRYELGGAHHTGADRPRRSGGSAGSSVPSRRLGADNLRRAETTDGEPSRAPRRGVGQLGSAQAPVAGFMSPGSARRGEAKSVAETRSHAAWLDAARSPVVC